MNNFLRLLIVGLAFVVRGQELRVEADHADAKYEAGETATFTVAIKGAEATHEATYIVKKGGLTEIARGKVSTVGGTFAVKLDEPGTLLAEVRVKAGEKDLRGLAGAAFSFAKIQRSAPRPADFDAFWAEKIKELHGKPINPVVEPADSGNAGIELQKLTMDGFRDTKIHGYVAKKKRPGKFPALLIVQWAGVYGLDKMWSVWPAGEGFLVVNISAHDLPVDESKEFYEAQADGPLKNYTAIGKDDREKDYFLRMYLSAYRAADYLAGRDDWDGKTLLVQGTSQGGLQSLMIAGLHPRISAAMANVPAGCDQSGMLVGRANGWPAQANWLQGDEQKKVLEVSAYFDCMNFAPNIKCPLLVGAGMIDETCPPAGIFATVNQTKGPREVILMPHSNHQGTGNAQKAIQERMGVWRKAVVSGATLPPAK